MAVPVTVDEIRRADLACQGAVSERLDLTAIEGSVVALELWVGPLLDGADTKPVTTERDTWGNRIEHTHLIEE